MKLISWNVNGIRACQKKGFLDFIDNQKPDILCIQETKADKEQLEPILHKPFGLNSFWSSAVKKGYSGVATYSKKRPQEVTYGIEISKFDSEGRFVITKFPQFLLYNIYFPNGASSDERHFYKMEFLNEMLVHLKKKLKEGEKIIVVGDYNVAHKAIDIHDPVRLSKTSGFLPEEREWFDKFIDLGFVDTFRYMHPEAKDRYSWWSYRELARSDNRGWRIDYICVSENLKSQIKSADILHNQMGSDHCPVVLEI